MTTIRFAQCLTLSLLPLVGCGASGRPSATPTRYVIFPDQTESITREQRARWAVMADALMRRLAYGDAITVFGIHDRTSDAAPLFDCEIPLIHEDSGREEMERAKRLLQQARSRAREVIASALGEPAGARVTDIFGAFDRYRPDPARRTLLIFLSDMLHSADRDMNFERTRLREESFPELIQSIARARDWHARTLAGAGVLVLLPSAQSGDKKPINEPRLLKKFYAVLIAGLGGKLASFDTHLPAGDAS